jgi:hypothetical protein
MNIKYKLALEGIFKDFLKRAKKQHKEVKNYKKNNPNRPLGGVKDFQRFEDQNKQIRARKKLKNVKLASMHSEGMWDNFKKSQKQLFKQKTTKLMAKQKRLDNGKQKPSLADRAVNSLFNFNKKSQQLVNSRKAKQNQRIADTNNKKLGSKS